MSDRERPLDSEINFRAIVGLTVGLLILVVVTGALMWALSGYLRDLEIAQDPPPPLLAEARIPHQPPEPRLQAQPPADMATLRASEELQLTTYGWVDESAQLARIPIARAMDLVVEHGVSVARPQPDVPAPGGDSPDRVTKE